MGEFGATKLVKPIGAITKARKADNIEFCNMFVLLINTNKTKTL